MPAGDRAVGVPLDLRVVVGVQVDEAGRDDQTVGLEHLVSVGRIHPAADLGDTTILDPHIGLELRHPGPVDHRAAANQNVKLAIGRSSTGSECCVNAQP